METFERKAYEKLASWKDSSQGSTALLIGGARRVGKSTIAEEFGRRNYASYMLVDFSKAPDDVLGYFVDLRNDLDAFFMYLSSFYGVELHRKAMRLFREYMLVGGMPQAVSKYVETHDFSKVDNVKRNILRLHRQDISKHGGSDRIRITRIFDNLVGQLSKKEKKFNITSLGKEAKTRDYEDAFFWLSDASITNDCFNSTDPSVGLSISEDHSTVKCYAADTGLLTTLALADSEQTGSNLYRDILLERIEINEGMLAENVVAQLLWTNGHRLFFYSRSDRDDPSNRMEIDFLIVEPYENAAMKYRVSPIEVKSSKNYRTVSLDKFKTKLDKKVGTRYVLHPKPLVVENDVVKLPIYMAGLL